MNRAEEDYLKQLYELSVNTQTKRVKSADLANALGHTAQSVNEMLKRLAEKKHVNYMPYRGVTLTKKGRATAVRMIRAHRLWEVFLSEKLGLSWEALHEEAEKLEHATSDVVLDKLNTYLAEPKTCIHGNPIPDADGHVEQGATLTLAKTEPGHVFVVQRVEDHAPLLSYLRERRIALGDRLEVVGHESLGDTLVVKHKGESHRLGMSVTNRIYGDIER